MPAPALIRSFPLPPLKDSFFSEPTSLSRFELPDLRTEQAGSSDFPVKVCGDEIPGRPAASGPQPAIVTHSLFENLRVWLAKYGELGFSESE